jgi:ABC-type uncharacterized transport system involved in gliding motility auxiliary subunit
MKLNPKKIAPYGLYLALVAALTAAGLYIVERSFNLPLQISLALIVVGLALYALLDPQKLKETLAGRQARYGSNAFILFLAFLGILIVINYVAFQNSPRVDLTEDKTNTLTTETMDTLAALTEPVKADAFFSSRFSSTTTEELLANYKRNSKGLFDYEFIDPEQDPVRANSAGVTRDGTIVLNQNGRTEQVSYSSEQELTNALVRLSNPGQRSVYFLTGHGEYSPDDSGDRSYSSLKTTLEAKNYTVTTLNLLAERQIPADALALIAAGPTKPLSQDEVSLIDAYLAQGGSLVYLVEPRVVTEFGDTIDPLAQYLSTNWGVDIGENMVIDLNYNPPVVALSGSYGQHAITEKMYNQATIFPSARSVTVGLPPSDVTVTPLVATSDNSWAETSAEELANEVSYTDGVDTPGPIQLASAAENTTSQARVVVVGDSDFAGGQYYAQYGNGDFITNIVDWAAQQDSLINLTPKTTTQRLLVSPSQLTMNLLLLGVIIVIPGLVVVAGITVWIQRRRRG